MIFFVGDECMGPLCTFSVDPSERNASVLSLLSFSHAETEFRNSFPTSAFVAEFS